jgi:hypothetical protein
MTRRRFVYIDGEPVEVTADYVAPPRDHGRVHGDLHYDGLRAPDGTDISTRTKHREYMKRTGLTTADDFSVTWQKQRAEREAYYKGERGTITKHDIGRAIAQLERSRR